MTPTAKKIMPRRLNSNMLNGSSPAVSAIELARMLVEVPRTVHMPPNKEANASGIRSFEGLVLTL